MPEISEYPPEVLNLEVYSPQSSSYPFHLPLFGLSFVRLIEDRRAVYPTLPQLFSDSTQYPSVAFSNLVGVGWSSPILKLCFLELVAKTGQEVVEKMHVNLHQNEHPQLLTALTSAHGPHAWVEGTFSTCPVKASPLQALGVIRYESVEDRIIVYQEFSV